MKYSAHPIEAAFGLRERLDFGAKYEVGLKGKEALWVVRWKGREGVGGTVKEGIVALRSLASIGTNERKQEKGKRENWEREKMHQQFKKPNQTEQEKKKVCVLWCSFDGYGNGWWGREGLIQLNGKRVMRNS